MPSQTRRPHRRPPIGPRHVPRRGRHRRGPRQPHRRGPVPDPRPTSATSFCGTTTARHTTSRGPCGGTTPTFWRLRGDSIPVPRRACRRSACETAI